MSFDPPGGSVSQEQTRNAFVYGGGLDVPMAKHIALRTQYRGFVYKIPDFEMTSFKARQVHSFRRAFRRPSIYVLDRRASSLLSTLQGGCFSRLDS